MRAATTDSALRGEIANELASSLGLRNGNEEAAGLIEDSLAGLPDPETQLGLALRGWLLLQVSWGLERVPDLAVSGPQPDSGSLPGRFVLGSMAGLDALGLGSIEAARKTAEVTISNRDVLMDDAFAGLPPLGALVALLFADRGHTVLDLFDLGIEASRQRGVLPGVGGNHGIRSFAHLCEGDLSEAQADAEIAVDILSRYGLVAPFALWSSVAVRILIQRGELDAAGRLLGELWGGKERVAGSPGAALLCSRGELRIASGRHAEARHDFLAAAERISWLPYPNPEAYSCLTGLARCEALLGNNDEAQRIAADAVDRARKAGGVRGIGVAIRALGMATGGGEGIELLNEAADTLAGTRARLQYAEALFEWGAALRRANFRKEARGPLREALELAHRCGARPLEERARVELAAAGARPRKAVFTGVESLTPSELRVARMATEGMTNREIAQALTVTAKTVETHMRHVFQKLDIAKRGELGGALG